MAKNVIINGVTYNDVPYVQIPDTENGTATFYDTSDADVTAGQIFGGKKAYGANGEIVGTMRHDLTYNLTITRKGQHPTYGDGYVWLLQAKIDTTEEEKIVSENIKSGVTILGVTGSATVKDVSGTTATANTVLSGHNFYNSSGVLTSGSLTVPVVSQDGTTKVLSIS